MLSTVSAVGLRAVDLRDLRPVPGYHSRVPNSVRSRAAVAEVIRTTGTSVGGSRRLDRGDRFRGAVARDAVRLGPVAITPAGLDAVGWPGIP